ncbi:MAG: flavin monoamine oxidase family protein [Solirubrobacteraceae bacterium]
MTDGDTAGGGTLTRRGLVRGGAAAASSVWLGGSAASALARRRVRRADVVVIGAGLAGLSAARSLERAGRSVLVLEARRRVGGRTLNHPIGRGRIAEAGGEYVGPTQDHIRALAASVGVGTFATYNQGHNLLHLEGRSEPYPADPGISSNADFLQLVQLAPTFDGLAKQVPAAAPWTAPRAAEWDRQTLAQFAFPQLPNSGARSLLSAATQAVWGAEPHELSLLYVLAYIAGAGNEGTPGSILRLLTTPGGAQESRLIGGSQLVSERVALGLRRRVQLAEPVAGVHQNRHGVRVQSRNLTIDAKAVVVAMSPRLSGQIAYAPRLPALTRGLFAHAPNGHLVKAEAVYDRPFWRASGFSGQAAADLGPCTTTFDNSPPDGSVGVFFGFIGGYQARKFARLSPARRRHAVLANFAVYLGPQARRPVEYFEMDWTRERWTQGCPVAHFPPNVLSHFGPALGRRVGRIHFAGTETADYWAGYMDGAVRSGERVAQELGAPAR